MSGDPMTDDRTQVETDELRRWARGARDRGDRMNEIADGVRGIDLTGDALGMISRAFCGDLHAKVQATADTLREAARHLETDSTDAGAVADSFDDIERAQESRFRGIDGHA